MLQTNYRTPAGEIDLIAEQPAPDGSEPTLVFIEVKTRRGARHGTPSESVQTRKQQKILAAALYFLAERAAGGAEPLCRFDVAEVCIGPEGLGQIRLLHGAFGMA
jgi:putative endonuclease